MKKLLCLAALLIFCLSPWKSYAAGAYVQSISEYPSDGIVSYASDVTSGNLLILVASNNRNDLVGSASVSDSLGNTWTNAFGYVDNDGFGASTNLIAWYTFTSSSGPDDVTITVPVSYGDLGIAVYEYSGIAGGAYAGYSAQALFPTTSLTPSVSVTTTASSTFVFSFVADENVNEGSVTADASSTLREFQLSHFDAQQDQFSVPATTFSSSFNLDVAANAWVMGALVFEESSSTPPSPVTIDPASFALGMQRKNSWLYSAIGICCMLVVLYFIGKKTS